MALDATTALGLLPAGLRGELLAEFDLITRNYREGRWGPAELYGGRLAEVVYTILDGYMSGGAYATTATKPRNFEGSCKALENRTAYPESARLTIPRVLVGLYDVRNRRNVGHVGGDVSANHMDAELVLATAKWIVAELIRMFHSTDVKTAAEVVDALVDRTLPVIWEVDGVKRVLDTSLPLSEQTLLLLYSETGALSERSLAKYLEQDKLPNYRRVLDRLHKARRVEWNRSTGMVTLGPPGRKHVEERLLK
ncbi:hypothetical protein ACWF0M_31730 [Kribbella sp. NPDC055110]